MENKIATLVGMGIERDDAAVALSASDGNLERAVDYIFSGRRNSQVHAAEADNIASCPDKQAEKVEMVEETTHYNSPKDSPMITAHLEEDGEDVPVIMEQEISEINENNTENLQFAGKSQMALPPRLCRPATRRSKSTGVPTVLVRGLDAQFGMLPGLLNCLYQVPLMRKLVFSLDLSPQDHGYPTPSWWCTGEVTLTEASGKHSLPIALQRLFGFVALSERAYGSPYNDWLAVQAHDIGSFLGDLNVLLRIDDESQGPFSTCAEDSEDEVIEDDVYYLDLMVSSRLLSGTDNRTPDLNDVLDEVIWDEDNLQHVSLARTADILCMSLKREDGRLGSGILTPIRLNIGRFSSAVRSAVQPLRDKAVDLLTEIMEVDSKSEDFSTHDEKSISEVMSFLNELDFSKLPNLSASLDVDDFQSKLKGLLDEVQSKKISLVDEKQNLEEEYKVVLATLREQKVPKNENDFDEFSYHLVGVLVDQDNFCYLYDSEGTIDLALPRKSQMQNGSKLVAARHEWIHACFANQNLSLERLDEMSVAQISLHCESSDVLLIYARESLLRDSVEVNYNHKIKVKFGTLAQNRFDSVKDFISRDNELLRAELDKSSNDDKL